jgi:hypothetical protein
VGKPNGRGGNNVPDIIRSTRPVFPLSANLQSTAISGSFPTLILTDASGKGDDEGKIIQEDFNNKHTAKNTKKTKKTASHQTPLKRVMCKPTL